LGVSKETLDTAAICVCVVAGVYFLVKWKDSGKAVAEVVSEAVLEGSSMEV